MEKKSTGFFTRWIIGGFVLLIIDKLFKGIYIEGFISALMISLILVILNHTVKPVLKFFAFPLTLLTFGLFSLVINGFVLSIASFVMGNGFVISSFSTAIFASIVMSIINALIFSDDDD